MLSRTNQIRQFVHLNKLLVARLYARKLYSTTTAHTRQKQSQHSVSRAMPKHDTGKPTVQEAKYCMNCGRLISPNHRNFEERKYCSKYCSSNRLQAIDRELEAQFRALARARGQISCDEMQQLFQQEDEAEAEEDGGVLLNHSDEHSNASTLAESDKHKAGMDLAKWRERVRRAARRVVAQSTTEERYECVQKGKVVESSYAKGDWSVRFMKS